MSIEASIAQDLRDAYNTIESISREAVLLESKITQLDGTFNNVAKVYDLREPIPANQRTVAKSKDHPNEKKDKEVRLDAVKGAEHKDDETKVPPPSPVEEFKTPESRQFKEALEAVKVQLHVMMSKIPRQAH